MTFFLVRLCACTALAWAALAGAALTLTGRAALPPVMYADLVYDGSNRLLLAQMGCDHWLLPCQTQTRALLSDLHVTYPVMAWSPDGALVAVRMDDLDWHLYPTDCLLAERPCPPVTLNGDWRDIRFAWGQDGSALALLDPRENSLSVMTRGCAEGDAARCIVWEIPSDRFGAQLAMPDWSADGRWLVFTSTDNGGGLVWMAAACLDAPDTCADHLFDQPTPNIPYWATLAPDGERAVYSAGAAPARSRSQLYLIERESGEIRLLTRDGEEAALPDWSPDGRYVVYSSSWRAAPDQIELALLDMARGLRAPAVRAADVGRRAWNVYPSWGVGLQ